MFISVIVVEIGLRIFVSIPISSNAFVFDDILGYKVRSGVLGSIDGFNSGNESKKTNNKKILFIGDSFTYGTYSSQYIFPKLVEKNLNNMGLIVSSYNRGLPGAGTSTYALLAEHFSKTINPTLIILTIYLGNDVEQSHPNQSTRLVSGMVATINNATSFGINKEDFLIYYAIRKAYEFVLFWLHNEKIDVPDSELELGRVSGFLSEYQTFHVAKRELKTFARLESKFMYESYAEFFERIKSIHNMVGRNNMLVVLAPTKFQTNELWRDKVLKFWNLDRASYDALKPNKIIAEKFSIDQIPYIDLVNSFSNENTELYNRFDTHWNRKGNEIAAREISEWVINNIPE